MTTAGPLEAHYRRLLRGYPAWYRARHGEELLGVLMTAAQPGQRRPGLRDVADLLSSGLKIRARTVLRGVGREPWTQAFALFAVLLPMLMVLLKLTELLLRGQAYGFGSPADILIGGRGGPGGWSRSFQLNPFHIALTGHITDMLTAGPLPWLVLAVLVCLGLRRTAAAVAACVPLVFVAIALTSNYTLYHALRTDTILYLYATAALALLASAGASPSWRTLRWPPFALLALATVSLAVAINGGLPGLFQKPINLRAFPLWRLRQLYPVPHGFLARQLGVGRGGWGYWLVAEGTLIAIIVLALAILLVSSPVNRRLPILLAVPLALGAVMYPVSLVSPPPPAALGNAVAGLPLLLVLLAAVALSATTGRRSGAADPANPKAAGWLPRSEPH